MTSEDRVFDLYGLGQHAHGRQIRDPQLALEPGVLQYCAGMISNREQELVVVLRETLGVVRAHHHAVELVLEVDRNGDQVLYLRVRPRIPLVPGILLSHRLVAPEHLSRETPDDSALGGVVLEAFRSYELQTAV